MTLEGCPVTRTRSEVPAVRTHVVPTDVGGVDGSPGETVRIRRRGWE